jgi:hypothetical protein
MWSAPITSVADSRNISVEAQSHGFALPVYASQPASPPDHATLGTGWLAMPCRAGPSPAGVLHKVSALHVASSLSVFIWRTVIENDPGPSRDTAEIRTVVGRVCQEVWIRFSRLLKTARPACDQRAVADHAASGAQLTALCTYACSLLRVDF